jgi:hypothetical protein
VGTAAARGGAGGGWQSLWIPLDPEDSGVDAIPSASCRSPAAGRSTPSDDGKRMAGDIPSPAVGSLTQVRPSSGHVPEGGAFAS